ncbi:MAG: adenosylhomocysteinase [Actinobacteria bacterium]|nr:adenosylhomocysteinase [Actinomycetota bacterium]
MTDHDVKDLAMAEDGKRRIDWAETQMPVLRLIKERFEKEKPFDGIRIAACLHVTTETANLVRTLAAGGAEVALCASNPLSTQDDTAASLVSDFAQSVFAVRGIDNDGYYKHIQMALDLKPALTVDDGADLVSTLHTKHRDLLDTVIGGTEETTTGVVRLRSMAAAGELRYPIVSVNDAKTKHLFDNRYGTGQSSIDGIIRATNILIAGRTVVVAGYGQCGRGVAARAEGLGANVVVTEIDPVTALEAVMDGYRVMPMEDAARIGDIFITVTGDRDVLTERHFGLMKDGAILANSGHFDVEIDVKKLRSSATDTRKARENVEEFVQQDGRRLFLIAEGRLVNLGAAEGHPAAVMDMSFANQALALEWLAKNRNLDAAVYPVPVEIDREVARLKLDSMGMTIDQLSAEQEAYLSSWQEGT